MRDFTTARIPGFSHSMLGTGTSNANIKLNVHRCHFEIRRYSPATLAVRSACVKDTGCANRLARFESCVTSLRRGFLDFGIPCFRLAPVTQISSSNVTYKRYLGRAKYLLLATLRHTRHRCNRTRRSCRWPPGRRMRGCRCGRRRRSRRRRGGCRRSG